MFFLWTVVMELCGPQDYSCCALEACHLWTMIRWKLLWWRCGPLHIYYWELWSIVRRELWHFVVMLLCSYVIMLWRSCGPLVVVMPDFTLELFSDEAVFLLWTYVVIELCCPQEYCCGEIMLGWSCGPLKFCFAVFLCNIVVKGLWSS